MSKTIMEMVEEMFDADYMSVYELAQHKYFKMLKGSCSKADAQAYIRNRGPHRMNRKQVEEIYTKYQNYKNN